MHFLMILALLFGGLVERPTLPKHSHCPGGLPECNQRSRGGE